MPDQLARQRSTTLLFYGCVLLLGYLLFLIFEPFLRPLAWAAILAAFFYSPYKYLERRYGKARAAPLATAAVALIIVVPFVLVTLAFIDEARQTLGVDGSRPREARRDGRARKARGAGCSGSGSAARFPIWTRCCEWRARAWAACWPRARVSWRAASSFVIVNVVIVLFALFFFFKDGDAIMGRIRRVLPFDPSFSEGRITETANLIRASISSGLIVALVQGAIGGLAFAVLGLGAPIFWGVIMAFFSLLPLGAWIVWFPASIWLLLTDQMARGIALMVIGAGGISLIDNFLRPWLLAGRTEMNGLLVFISLLGGISAFGLVGLVLGPVIMATAISFVDAYATDRREVTDTR